MTRKLFLVRLRTENDAMQDPAEVAKALRELADRVENNGAKSGLIRDGNGNTCGSFLWSLANVPDASAEAAAKWAIDGK